MGVGGVLNIRILQIRLTFAWNSAGHTSANAATTTIKSIVPKQVLTGNITEVSLYVLVEPRLTDSGYRNVLLAQQGRII